MSRLFNERSARYIAVAARLLSWGAGAQLNEMFGDDQLPKNAFLHKHFGDKTSIDRIWEQLDDSERGNEVAVLLVFRIVDPTNRKVHSFNHYFTSPESMASAARMDMDGFFINMKTLKRDFDSPR